MLITVKESSDDYADKLVKIDTHNAVEIEKPVGLVIHGMDGDLVISDTEHGLEVTYKSRVGVPSRFVSQVLEFRGDGEIIRVDRV